ncbi:MAG: tripartite tricarboxylate transporter substrate binding protein BugD, partial [Bradyrhizobium icense]
MASIKLALAASAVALATAVTPQTANAQAYPSRTITLVVPAAAGGPTDTVARLIGESMSKTLGQTIIVENIGGAGGTIGMARVAKAAPDGYTISIYHIAQATHGALYDNLQYSPANDFDNIGRIADVPMTLVSKTALTAKNVKELIDWIKAEAGKVTYGHAGIGSASHLCTLVLMKELNLQMVGVAYRG